MVLSKFETLPPELLVETGDYLDGCDFYFAMYGLSRRIDAILDQHFHRIHVNFTHTSKAKFDLFCNRILPHMSARVVSLTFGGEQSSTPGQLVYFLSLFRPLSTFFPMLESFKLVDFVKMNVQILLPHLALLTHLKCLSIGEHKRLMPFEALRSDLFSEEVPLPISLRTLSFPYSVSRSWIQTQMASTSLLEHLHAYWIHIDALPLLLERWPCLKILTAVLTGHNPNEPPAMAVVYPTVISHTLRHLNVNITPQVLFDTFAQMCSSLPQLRSLTLEALNPDVAFCEARSWETVLPMYLVSFDFNLTIEEQMNVNHLELLPAFKTVFWLTRGWFVECRTRNGGFRLSTIKSPIVSILYWPDDETLVGSTPPLIYSNVTHVELWWNLSRSSQAICPNVRSVQLYGAGNEEENPLDPNVCQLLQCSSLEHVIINDNTPINPTRLVSVLALSSTNIRCLTCSANWLIPMIRQQQYEWCCLLVTKRIHKLNIITDDEFIVSHADLIAFCRTFINLRELTMKVESAQDLLFLLNMLEKLVMARIELPSNTLDDSGDIAEWIRKNTSLENFIARKDATEVESIKLILWIGSRR